MSSLDLFSSTAHGPITTPLGEDAWLFHQFLTPSAEDILSAVRMVLKSSPLRYFTTPSGGVMSVKSSNCGQYGWLSDTNGYRYQRCDPLTQQPWPALPSVILEQAVKVSREAGFQSFTPDSCLINVYTPGAKMGLHQDKDEAHFEHPIVSFSLGLPAVFLWGGIERTHPYQKVPLTHGDAIVWGGRDRLRYHGVQTIKSGDHPLTRQCRVNLTLRQSQ